MEKDRRQLQERLFQTCLSKGLQVMGGLGKHRLKVHTLLINQPH